MKKPTFNWFASLLVAALFAASHASAAVTLADNGGSAPTPGTYDISQLSNGGDTGNPSSKNYYSNNNPPPGQEFTTGANAGGYTMTDIYVQTGNGSGNGIGGSTAWTLYIYSVSGSKATVLYVYSGLTSGVSFSGGDWLHFGGLTIPLAANNTYAYAIYSGTSAYTGLENSTATVAGANAELIPTSGGSMTSVSGFNGVFDVALALGTTASVSQRGSAPTPAANDVSQLSTAGDASNPNSANYFSNDNSSGTPVSPGEQFTTPSGNPAGYTLTNLYVMTGNGSGNGITNGSPWVLYIYSVSGSTATLLTNYSGNTGVIFTNGAWISFGGLSVNLAANATYAYAISTGNNNSSPYTGLENSSAALSGAKAVLVNTGSGAITTVTGFNGVFDAGLSPIPLPAAPTAVTATPGNNHVTISWTAPPGTITGYNVYRSTTSGSGYAVLAAGANVAGSPFTDNTAVNGTTYYYVITALNGALESADSTQVTATPPRAATVVTWNGIQAADNNWTVITDNNWLGAGTTFYINGDYAIFNDNGGSGAQTINLNTAVNPGSLTFVNTNVSYTINGNGAISGSTVVSNAGPGTVTLAETGGDSFSGGIAAIGGTLILDNANSASAGGAVVANGALLQVGNSDGNGSLPSGNTTNNGILVFNHGANFTVANKISGSGVLIQEDGNMLTLSGANSFTNYLLVTNNSTLQVNNDSALGTTDGPTIVANGSTLDVNGFYNDTVASEPVMAQGMGVGGNGALVNNNGYGDLLSITLTGDTTIGGTARFDATGKISTGGNPFNITVVGSSYHEWNDLTADPALANVTVGGSVDLGYKGTTTIGNPAYALSILSGATLTFWQNGQPVLTKHLILNDGSTLDDGDANAIINGPVTLTNSSSTLYCNFNISGPSVTINGPLDGDGVLYMTSGTGMVVVNSNSPTFSGGAQIYAGTLKINANFGSGNVSVAPGGILTGTGSLHGLADISGALLPGSQGVAGTFTAADGLTLEGSAAVTNDLSSTIAGSNDLIVVVGDLTANGNTIVLNPLNGTLQNGIYPLITYTGNLNGSFGGVQTVSPTAYVLTLTNITSTSPKQIAVIVGGNPSLLAWNNASGDGEWNIESSFNWSNLVSHASEQFANADTVIFDDSITNSANWGQAASTNIDIASGLALIPSVITNNSSVDYTLSGAGKITGSASLVKLGSGTLTISNQNDFSGGMTISGGTVLAYGSGGTTALGSGTPVVNPAGTLVGGAGDAFGYAPNLIPTNIMINGGTVSDLGSASYRITLPNVTFAGGTLTSAAGNNGDSDGNYSTWGDGNSCTITTLATNSTAVISAGAIGLGRPTTFNVAAGNVTSGPTPGVDLLITTKFVPYGAQPLTKTGTGVMAIDANNTFGVPITLSAGTVQLGTASDAAALTSPLGQWPVVTNNAVLTFASSQPVTVTNAIVGTGSVSVKSGVAILNGVNTYTGNTTISGGVLSGTGVVGAGMTVSAGGAIAPGTSASIGLLTVNGAANLNGATVMKLNAGVATNDVLAVGGALTYGGTLTVTNIAGTLAANQSFKLISAASVSANFAATNLPTLGGGLVWSWNPASGMLSVIQTVNTSPTSITNSVNGSILTLSWPVNHIGWRLQVQTNSLNAGLGTNWADVAGSTTTNLINVNIVPANGAVFYRMIYP